MKDRLLDVLKGAVELNLRYTSAALNLSKEYLKEIDRVVREGSAAKPAPPVSEPRAPPARRSPILLVGELNEEVTSAFALNNTAGTELRVNLVVQGDLGAEQVQLSPASLVLAPGASAFVRLKVKLTEALQENRDYVGVVLAPGLSAQAIEFVVHRLSGAPTAKPST